MEGGKKPPRPLRLSVQRLGDTSHSFKNIRPPDFLNHSEIEMRWLFVTLLLGLLSLVQALSSTGSRLLAITEDAAEKDKYSKLWADLEGKYGINAAVDLVS